LAEARPDLPPALCRLVHSLLAKDPRERCPSARELLRDLRQLWNEFVPPDWQEEVPRWEVPGEPAASPHAAVTERLEGLMQTLASENTARRFPYSVIAAIAAALLLGALGAWLTAVDRPLLTNTPAVPAPFPQSKTKTVEGQWLLASNVGTAEAWQSIERYFPQKTSYILHAKQHLALLYLQEDEDDRALGLFDELAKVDEYESIQAFGLAGRVSVLCREKKYDDASKILQQLWPIRQQLQNRRMQQLLETTIQKNRSQLGSLANSEQWDQWLKNLFKEEPEEPEKNH
jgi:eukaryotic-like serine/threonine-protein kinase